jgi:hypothetical protein
MWWSKADFPFPSPLASTSRALSCRTSFLSSRQLLSPNIGPLTLSFSDFTNVDLNDQFPFDAAIFAPFSLCAQVLSLLTFSESDPFPPSFSRCSGCNLTTFPKSFAAYNIRGFVLSLTRNKFSGSLPSGFAILGNLQTLYSIDLTFSLRFRFTVLLETSVKTL